MKNVYGADVIGFSEIGSYLAALKAADSRPRPKSKATPAARIRGNATAIIMITRSLALQIDTKLEALKQQNPNSDDAIAERDAAVSEYEELRRRVSELEAAVAKLKQKNPKTTPVVKAGNAFGKTISKWWDTSGPKHLTDTASMGIIMTSAGILHLMGVEMGWAAAIAAYVTTGKAPSGLLKAATGH
jgi:hypothetical protein